MKTRNLLSVVLVVLLLVNAASVKAQIPACTGWNNPTSFTFAPSAEGNEVYRGMTGTKPSTAGNCTTGTTGVTLTGGMITASNLATTTDNGGNYDCGSTLGPSNQFRIMSSTDYSNGKDPLVGTNPGIPIVPPSSFGTFTRSIRLGNCQVSAHAEALYYDFDVNFENSLMLLNYAIIAEAPGHGVSGDPAFWVRVLVESTPGSGTFQPIDASYCYVVSSTPSTNGGSVTIGQDGWHSSGSGYSQILYRDWNQVAISLANLIYRRVRIEVIMGDCSASGHYAYCYIAGSCQPMKLSSAGCAAGAADTVTFVQAPSNLDAYKWYYFPDGINPDPTDVDPDNYIEINDPGTNTDRLAVRSRYFLPRGYTLNDDTLNKQTTILCRMTSHMNPAMPFYSYLRTDIDNLKPIISLDTLYACDNTVNLTDYSTAYSVNGGRGVDYTLSEWTFYDLPTVTPMTPVAATATGPTATHTFERKGNHSVRLRSFNIDSTTCYAEKVIKIRSLTAPAPKIDFSSPVVCADSIVTIYDNTVDTFGFYPAWTIMQSNYHRWHIYDDNGFDTTFTTMQNHFDIRLKDTCWVELTCHVNYPYWGDTNQDGISDLLYCDGTARKKIFVEAPPTLKVIGDTIVCNGRTSIVSVQASLPDCTYKWYEGNPSQGGVFLQDGNTLTTQPTTDKRYFVQVASAHDCKSWDSIEISILKPTIDYVTKYGKPEICEGDTVKLWSSRAMKYDWTATPNDVSLIGQEHADTVWCTPHSSTEFAVVGYGGSGDHECQADPMKQKITVHPYPELAVRLTPDYIDSDNPSVQFSDESEYGTSSLWDFGNGATSTIRSVVYTFTDLSQDSIQIHLISYNPLGCSRDTSFWIPVGIFSVWYPNAFTPRLETNREFRAFTNNQLEDYEIYIYDRGGQLVFHSIDPAEPWDGTCKGNECQQGAYVWIAHYRRPGVERLLKQKGTVLLLK